MSWLAKKVEKQRMKKLYDETKTWYGCGCYHNDKRGGVLTRAYPYSTNHANMKKWWRRHSNRKFRRNETDILNGALHKRGFDLWWTLY